MIKILRLLLIGLFHATCYLWLIPFVIIPEFGEEAAVGITAGIILISLIIIYPALKSGKGGKGKRQ